MFKCKECPIECYKYTNLCGDYIKFNGGNRISFGVETIVCCIQLIILHRYESDQERYVYFNDIYISNLRKEMLYIMQEEYEKLYTKCICYNQLSASLRNSYNNLINKNIKIEVTRYKEDIDILYLDILIFLYGYPMDEDNMLFNHMKEYVKNKNIKDQKEKVNDELKDKNIIKKIKDNEFFNTKEKIPDFSKCHATYRRRNNRQRDSNLQTLQKKYLMKHIGKCMLCGKDTPGCLIFSHIKPSASCTVQERRDIYNGLLLCADHDNLFDKGYITFNNKGGVIISYKITKENQEKHLLNIYIKISTCKQREKYFEYHRTLFKE